MTGRSQRRPLRLLGARVEALEPRDVPTAAMTSSVSYAQAAAKHAYDQFVSELQRIELRSAATPAEYLALRDDTRAISEAVSAVPAASTTPDKLVAATVLIDRALLEGSLGDAGWSESAVGSQATWPRPGSPRAARQDGGRHAGRRRFRRGDPGAAQVLFSDLASVQRARNLMHGGTPSASFRDPEVYYTQHLRGFFRGWAQQKTADENRLRADLAATPNGPGGVLGRDVVILEQLGAPIPSDANRVLTDAYVAAFAAGTPSPAALSAFRATAIVALGATASAPASRSSTA